MRAIALLTTRLGNLPKQTCGCIQTRLQTPSLLLSQVDKGTAYQCVGDRILHPICCSRTMDLGLHIAVHARTKSFLRHTDSESTQQRVFPQFAKSCPETKHDPTKAGP